MEIEDSIPLREEEQRAGGLIKLQQKGNRGGPVWPSGKALGWEAKGPRFDPLRLSFLFSSKIVVYGHRLVTFAHTINETLKWLTQLPTLMQNHSGCDSVTSRC